MKILNFERNRRIEEQERWKRIKILKGKVKVFSLFDESTNTLRLSNLLRTLDPQMPNSWYVIPPVNETFKEKLVDNFSECCEYRCTLISNLKELY